jgi:hypothetical protein
MDFSLIKSIDISIVHYRVRIYKVYVSFTICYKLTHTHIYIYIYKYYIYKIMQCNTAIFLLMTYNTCRKAEVETSDDL